MDFWIRRLLNFRLNFWSSVSNIAPPSICFSSSDSVLDGHCSDVCSSDQIEAEMHVNVSCQIMWKRTSMNNPNFGSWHMNELTGWMTRRSNHDNVKPFLNSRSWIHMINYIWIRFEQFSHERKTIQEIWNTTTKCCPLNWMFYDCWFVWRLSIDSITFRSTICPMYFLKIVNGLLFMMSKNNHCHFLATAS